MGHWSTFALKRKIALNLRPQRNNRKAILFFLALGAREIFISGTFLRLFVCGVCTSMRVCVCVSMSASCMCTCMCVLSQNRHLWVTL